MFVPGKIPVVALKCRLIVIPIAVILCYNRFMLQVICIDKAILGGTPCFAGSRVPVRSLFDHLRLGYTVDGFLEQFPTVRKEQAMGLLEQSSLHGEQPMAVAERAGR